MEENLIFSYSLVFNVVLVCYVMSVWNYDVLRNYTPNFQISSNNTLVKDAGDRILSLVDVMKNSLFPRAKDENSDGKSAKENEVTIGIDRELQKKLLDSAEIELPTTLRNKDETSNEEDDDEDEEDDTDDLE